MGGWLKFICWEARVAELVVMVSVWPDSGGGGGGGKINN